MLFFCFCKNSKVFQHVCVFLLSRGSCTLSLASMLQHFFFLFKLNCRLIFQSKSVKNCKWFRTCWISKTRPHKKHLFENHSYERAVSQMAHSYVYKNEFIKRKEPRVILPGVTWPIQPQKSTSVGVVHACRRWWYRQHDGTSHSPRFETPDTVLFSLTVSH